MLRLLKQIRKKNKERREKKKMEKLLAKLKELLDSGIISQEEYDLATSKLSKSTSETEDSISESTENVQDNENQETANEQESENAIKEDSELNDEETVENDPAEEESVSDNITEDTSDDDPNEGLQQQILEALHNIQGRLDALEGKSANEVEETKEETKKKEPLTESDYGPGIRTIYRK